MTINEKYDELLNEFLNELNILRKEKAKEYSGNNDILINFLHASKRQGKTPEAVLYDWMDKHINSIDMHIKGIVKLSYPKLKEKVKDITIYLTLLLAMNINENKEN